MNPFDKDWSTPDPVKSVLAPSPTAWQTVFEDVAVCLVGEEEKETESDKLEASFYEFVKAAWSTIEAVPFIDSWHIGAIAEHLQAVTAGQIPKLLINIPPGCSKSLLTSVFWPAWEWARDPSMRFFYTSYDQRLSTRDSVKCRALFQSQWFKKLWTDKIVLTGDQNQKTYYETDKGGYRLATSIGGHGTGEHPDRIVYDDPHNVRKAESELERQNVLDYYSLTMSTRGVSRKARQVIIMQRLHHKDLSGYVLAEGGFVHICLPMRYEKGRMVPTPLGWTDPRKEERELLTPQQFDEDAVKEMEKRLQAYGTAGQLQQRPQPKGGGMFKEWYFNQIVKAAPYVCSQRIRYWDRAATADGGCATAGVLMSQDPEGSYYVEDVVWGQWEPDERNKVIRATALKDRRRYGPKHEPQIWVEREGGSSGRDAWKGVVKALSGFYVREDAVTGQKDTRAEPWACQLAAGNVYIVDESLGNAEAKPGWDINGYVLEHVMFRPLPGKRIGGLVDRIDASSGAFNLMSGAAKPGTLRTYNLNGKMKNAKLRLVVCSRQELTQLEIEPQHKCLLITITDPPYNGHEQGAPEISPGFQMVDYLQLAFADMKPADYQNRWNDAVMPWGKKPEELVMGQEHGKQLWRAIKRKTQVAADVYVIVDEGDGRALSIALGICHMLGLDKEESIYKLGIDEGKLETDVPPNEHIFNVTKSSMSLVL